MVADKLYFNDIYSNKKPEFDEDSKLMKEILSLKRTGGVLDIGCGEGGNSLYLAKKGFDVECRDISPIAIKRIQEEARNRKLNLKARVADLEEFIPDSKYDLILATGIFHLLDRGVGLELVSKLKEALMPEGLFVIIAFSNKDALFEKDKLYFSVEQLRQIYSGWKIIKFERFKERDLFGVHSLVKLIVVKPYGGVEE